MDFFYDENEEKAKFYRDVKLKDQDCETFYEKLHFKFLQMPAFNKTEKELKTKFDKWAYFLKNLESFEDMPQILNEEVFQRAFGTAEIVNFTPQQKAEYEQSGMNYLGLKAVFDTAKDEKEVEIILKLYKKGKSALEISDLLDIAVSDIPQILQTHSQK